MSWWDSFDTLSKIQTALAIFISILGIATLTIKLRGDILKRQSDTHRAIERAKIDKELQEQTATALRATTELDARTRPKPFRQRLCEVLSSIDSKILPALKAGNRNFNGGITASQFTDLQKIASESGATEFIIVDPGVNMGVGMGPEGITYGVKFTVSPKLLDSEPQTP